MNCAILVILAVGTASLTEQEYDNFSPELHDVLSTECFSDIDRRSALDKLRTDGTESRIWWQSGFVRQDGKWTALERAITERQQDRLQVEYQQLAKSETIEALAKWSLKQNQRDRFRALVMANMPPDQLNPQLLQKMGWFEADGQWLSPETAYGLIKQTNLAGASTARWGDKLLGIREGLDGSTQQAKIAEKLLGEIGSPSAVHAIDQILGSGSPRCQRLAVQALARIPSARSSQFLARYAVLSPLESVRKTATNALANRPMESFVPILLGMLTSVKHDVENVSFAIPLNYDQSIPWWNQTFHRAHKNGVRFQTTIETATQLRVHRSDLTALFVHMGQSTELALGSHNADLRLGGAWITRHGLKKIRRLSALYGLSPLSAGNESKTLKERYRAKNERTMAVLSSVSEKKSEEPHFWWDWWNRYTDVDAPEKQLVEVNEQQSVATFTVAWSCFAANTPVLTEVGPRPIETLRVGDRVASQDVDTGELSFRVIEKATIRPPRKTHIIKLSSESIRCTGGHNFWKAGTGWVKARDLEPGDRIRTPTGTEAVTAVATSEPAKTYNLVVEGFHTYFVGDSKLLVQDVLPITPTDNVLPGLSRFALGEDEFGETDHNRSR